METFLTTVFPTNAGVFWGASSWSWAAAFALIMAAVRITIRVTALFIVPPKRKPTAAMAWLLLIFLLPVTGMVLFLVLGRNDLPKAREAKQVAVDEAVSRIAKRADARLRVDPSSMTPGVRGSVALGESLGAQPILAGNDAHVTTDYEGSIESMAKAIDAAEDYVHVEFYILQHDKTTDVMFEALRRAKDRGVRVLVLLDHIASVMNPLTKQTARSLDAVTTRWEYMLPVRPFRGQFQRPDLRNHRKLLIVDGTKAFMGSQNLVDSSYNKKGNLKRGLHWRDIMVELTGPIVLGLEAVFQGDWYMETGEILPELAEERFPAMGPGGKLACQIVPSGPAYAAENNLQVFVSLLYAAERRISITSPYFVPDESVMNALRAATARGVHVELFVSETGDQAMVYHAQRSYYTDLLAAGVKIWMFKPPYILHSKHFTVDEETVVIGSSNMDERSFSLNMEVSMVVHGEEFVREIDEVTEYYRDNSRELTQEEWDRQPLRSHLLDNLARLTSALQ